mmetsp:Transcript_17167/g.16613  ORF Transcript_17167/g.16613 Transcript_17167/m.16613 type:complete len:229 (-) Transcript_17167:72-758(-)|eukprot:CAMPEP_0197832530 /NCGR_PEP_ID=MMETSP1437-20131217/15232_1 /TAXON_ID=49252 ORGANISM="Eucampia antarctica, Strain CCMP1452" /NCGR_SAMPLE_ID=MMETSP1437 /ASSEMBLY_ACC=CAM_ASM_001096 /LENGTH=228 /DNA_ID=CAMNT_0043435959 /DNA_START=129 /DNA_END=815 /DNA_ORIENTATION=+
MNWFGKSKSKPQGSTKTNAPARTVSDPGSTIVKLRENVASQEKREEHLQRKVNALIKEAKMKMEKKDKKGALFALKRKKLYENEINKIENVKMTLETQVMNLESAAQNAQTFQAMTAGKDAMKKVRQDVGLERVDDVMDDIREEMEAAQEVSDALAQPVDPLLTDEDDLLAELEELEALDVEAELLKPTPADKVEDFHMPAVPNQKLPELEKKEADELRKLEAELAGL